MKCVDMVDTDVASFVYLRFRILEIGRLNEVRHSWAAMERHFRVGLQEESSKQKQDMQKAVVLNTSKQLSGILHK